MEIIIMKLERFAILGTASLLVTTLSLSSYAVETLKPSSASNSSQTLVANSQPMAVMTGNFLAAEKPTTGTAKIVREDDHYYLELDAAFSTSEQGPDLHVLLAPEEQPPQTYQNINNAVNLGKLQNYNGSQRYPIPDAINPSEFKSVVIWCRMANATFGYAPLRVVSNTSRL
jgi:hypothetical protein